MANRRDYSVDMPGTCAVDDGGNKTSVLFLHSRSASRQATDYNRRKPVALFLKPTTYFMTEQTNVHPNGSWSMVYWTGSNKRSETGMLGWHTTPQTLANQCQGKMGMGEGFPSELANRALMKARSSLKGTDINLGQAFGERRQTAALVEARLRSMRKHLTKTVPWTVIPDPEPEWFKRARRRKTIRMLDGAVHKIPELWLEVIYGWKPMISDIYGAVAELDKRDKSDWKVTVFGKAHAKSEYDGILNATDARNSCFAKAKIFHGSRVRIDAVPGNAALQKASQLGLVNPVSLAWELMPWSFVLDWAYPLGPYFDQMDACLAWEILGYSTSNFSKATYDFTGRTFTTPDGWTYTHSWNAKRRFVRLDRGTGSTVPFPMLPSIKDPFSSSLRVGSALALLSQALRRRSSVIARLG